MPIFTALVRVLYGFSTALIRLYNNVVIVSEQYAHMEEKWKSEKVKKRKSGKMERWGCRVVDLLINWSLFPQVGSLFVSRRAGGGKDGGWRDLFFGFFRRDLINIGIISNFNYGFGKLSPYLSTHKNIFSTLGIRIRKL